MKNIRLTCALLAFASFANAQQSPSHELPEPVGTITLDAVTSAVLENNPSIKEAQAKWQAAVQRVPQAAAWEDLKVSAGSRVGRFVSIAPNGFGDQMLSIEQMIPLSGKNKSRARSASIEVVIASEEIRRRKIDVLSKARAAFFRLANTYALLELNKADEASLTQVAETIRTKFKSGGQSQSDVLIADNEVAKIHEARQDLLQNVTEEEAQISLMMNRDPFRSLGRPVGSASDFSELSTERLKNLTLSSRPEIRAADAMILLAQEKLDFAKREKIPDPTLSVTGQRYNQASQIVSEVAVGISINIPWLNRKKYRAEEEEAVNSIEAARHAAAAARADAMVMLRVQLQKVETARHHVALYQSELIPTAKHTVEDIRSAYETDKKSFVELLTAQQSLRELQTMLQKHLSEQATETAELEAIVGADRSQFSPVSSPKKKSRK